MWLCSKKDASLTIQSRGQLLTECQLKEGCGALLCQMIYNRMPVLTAGAGFRRQAVHRLMNIRTRATPFDQSSGHP